MTSQNKTSDSANSWDREVDVLVIGSGASGMTAALVSALEGARTLLCEKAALLGGTSALSGGTVWIPGSTQTNRAGLQDSREDGLRFMKAEVPYKSNEDLLQAYIDYGPEAIDYLEQPGKLRENLNDNLYGPLVLAAAAANAGCHMLYMGTGCIFEYDESHPASLSPLGSEAGFTESSLPNFFGSGYSTVKGYTDRLMNEMYGGSALNVRIRMPISSQDGPRNFISKIIAYKNICSIQNSMTVMDDVLPILADCMIKREVGTLSAVNPGTMDHSTILTIYRDVLNPDHTWNEISNRELVGRFVKGARSNNYLETNRIESLCPTIPTLESSVRRILTENKFAGRKSDS
jgi:3,5-epimerase/4-reductase